MSTKLDFSPTEKCKSKVLKNRALRKIFGPKSEEAPGKWRRLNMEQLHDLYFCDSCNSGDIINKGITDSILVRKPEGKRQLGRPTRRWVLKQNRWEWSGSVYGQLYRKCFFFAATAQLVAGPPHLWGFCITNKDTPQSVKLLWTRDRPVAEMWTWW